MSKPKEEPKFKYQPLAGHLVYGFLEWLFEITQIRAAIKKRDSK